MAVFKPLGGKSRRYQNVETGEIISRRKYQQITHGISFEEKARRNLEKSPETAVLRPARGRKSALTSEARELIAQARLEDKLRRAEIAAEKKQKAKIARDVKRFTEKKAKQKKITKALLQPGRLAARITFSDYAGYKRAMKEMQSLGSGVVFAYGVGVVLANVDTGEERDATLLALQDPRDEISEDELNEVTDEFILSRSYGAAFARWFLHVAYAKGFAADKAKRYGKQITWG